MSTLSQIESQGYNFPCYGDEYRTENGTITSGVENQQVFADGTLALINSLEIINDETAGTGYNLLVALNDDANNQIAVNAGETKSISGMPITAVYITNSSGANIDYRITAIGVTNL